MSTPRQHSDAIVLRPNDRPRSADRRPPRVLPTPALP
jgi:hypothetical protein